MGDASEVGQPELIPLRMLNELAYCPRLFHFMHVQGLMLQSAETLEGTAQHRRAEARRNKSARGRGAGEETPRADPAGGADAVVPWPVPRTLAFASQALGVVGRLDAVESAGGYLVPVEAKRGRAPDPGLAHAFDGIALDASAWPGDQVQIAGQMLLLEDAGYPVRQGSIYYRESRTRVEVALTPALRQAVARAVDMARRVEAGPMPPPLVDSPKCVRCSLAPACLPDEMRLLRERVGEPRRLYPARDDAGVLYVQTRGAQVGKSGDTLEVRERGTVMASLPLKDVAHVTLFGSVEITSGALHALLAAERTVAFCGWSGRIQGMALPFSTHGTALRLQQYRKLPLPEFALVLARQVVVSKVLNQRTLLRRNLPEAAPRDCLGVMERAAEQAATAPDHASLMGHEGEAARAYFGAWPLMLDDEAVRQSMLGRSRRPPRDPVNAALSFCYALLLRDCVTALVSVGLDPHLGALHAVKPGRPALALDLMEAYRPLVADSAVLRVWNSKSLGLEHADRTPAGVFLTDAGRRRLITAYEQRMADLVTHPAFGYRVSYRRLLEVEARLLARWLEGELAEWKPLRTR